ADNLSRVRLLDATYLMPADPEAAHAMYLQAHIAGAGFFEIDRVADHSQPLPHMMPDAELLALELGRLGITRDDTVVVYDRSPNHFSAPRVWKTLRAFGHEDVHVLDGGLQAWISAGNGVESGEVTIAPVAYRPHRKVAMGICSIEDMKRISSAGRKYSQILDARAEPRFKGDAPEPRAGLKSGHMPNALNLP